MSDTPTRGRHQVTSRFKKTVLILLSALLASTGVTASVNAPAYAGDGGGAYNYLRLKTYQGNIVACVDGGRADPVDSQPYTQSTISAPVLGYQMWKYSGGTPLQRSAMMVLAHRSTEVAHRDRPGWNGASSVPADVQATINTIIADTNRLRGPWTITAANTTNPSMMDGTVRKTFTIRSGTGQPVPGAVVAFARTGSATSLSATSGTTNANGQVAVTYELGNGDSGGVNANVAVTPPTTLVKFTPAVSDYQGVVGKSPNRAISASSSATRPDASSIIRIIKRDSQTDAPLAGARFEVTRGASNLGSGTTGPAGVVDLTLPVLPGTLVRVEETNAPAGYGIDVAAKTMTTGAAGGTRPSITFTDTKTSSIIRIVKRDAATDAPLANAAFTVTGGNPSRTLATGRTSVNGILDLTLDVPPGTTVRVTETSPPPGYRIDVTSKTVATGNTTRPSVTFTDTKTDSMIRIVKRDARNQAPLAGARFQIRLNSTGALLFTTGPTGAAGYVDVDLEVRPGTVVRVTEIDAPDTYLLDTTVTKNIPTGTDATASVTFVNQPQGRVSVLKTDAATDRPLAGATFRALFNGVEVARGTTNAQGLWLSGYLGRGIKVGDTVTLEEVTPPTGYLKVPNRNVVVTRDGSGTARYQAADSRVGGLVRVLKLDSRTNAPLPGVSFTAEVSRIGTDGTYGPWTRISGGNEGGTTVAPQPGGGVRYITAPSGIYVGRVSINGNTSTPKFVYGDRLRFTEVATAPGRVMPLPADRVVTGTAGANGQLALTAENQPYTDITISKVDSTDGTVFLPGAVFQVYRTVNGAEQLLANNLVTGPDGKVSWEAQQDASGRDLSGATSTDGLNRPVYAGDVVFLREVTPPPGYNGVTTPIRVVIPDSATVNPVVRNVPQVPAITTSTASDFQSTALGKVLYPGAVVTDTVAYDYLIPGNEYTVTGRILLKDGTTVSETGIVSNPVTFTATAPSGTIEVPFPALADIPEAWYGKELVVYERMTGVDGAGDPITIIHEDPADAAQFLYVPLIGTQAQNAEAELGKMVVSGTELTDVVSYSGLQPGRTYQLTAKFVRQADGADTGIAATTTFVPETSTGTTTVRFTPTDEQIEAFRGQNIVAFERLALRTATTPDTTFFQVADHEVITDAGQTVRVPEIGTTAQNGDAGFGKVVTAGTLTDVVAYTGLQPGIEYTVTGEFQVKGNPGDAPVATGIKSSATFTPTAPDGEVTVTFTVTPEQVEQFRSKTLVAFETLETGDYTIAIHADINDEAQTVYVPGIGTTATDSLTGLQNVRAGNTITDRVTYTALAPGDYTMNGRLMVYEADGTVSETGVTATSDFTATTPNGTVNLIFTVPESLFGKHLVVYERLVVAGGTVPVATHEDSTDVGQQVWIPTLATQAQNLNAALGKLVQVGGGTIIDRVTYTGLRPGVPYTVKGEFWTAESDGMPTATKIEGNATFTPDTANGTVDVTFEVTAAQAEKYQSKTLVAFETLYQGTEAIAAHTDIADAGQSVFVPQIGTTARNNDPDLGKLVVPNGTLTDTVAYRNLQPGLEYVVTGEFQLVKDGEATATGVKATTTFTPTAANGTVTLEFTLPNVIPDAWRGETLVAFEAVTRSGVLVAIHADITDQAQTVYVPELSTVAANSDNTLGKVVTPGATIIDTVRYTGLQPGLEYTVTGKFVTGDGTDTKITGTTTFTPGAANGTVDVEFKFPDNIDALRGQKLVAFETLTINEKTVHIHADLNDADQTVYVPTIGTQAQNANPDHGKVVVGGGKLTDVIAYTNLEPGKEYTASGEFQLVKDGKVTPTGIKGSVKFTPTTRNGTVTVTFNVPAEVAIEHQGEKLVAFERVTQGDVEIAIHADVNDEAQTVYVPRVRTLATNATAAYGKTVVPGGTIIDQINYQNLEPGKEYTVRGEFQLIENGKVTPTGIKGETTFTPTTRNGTTNVSFDVPASLDTKMLGRNMVAFETLSQGGVTIFIHADVNDAAQTVFIPKVGTVLTGPNGAKQDIANNAVLTDKVSYTNLTPGVEYTVKGELRIKDGKETGSATKVTGETKFTPTTRNGTVNVTFDLSKANLASAQNMTVVAFERLYVTGQEAPIATHEDIADAAQTVTISGGDISVPPDDQDITQDDDSGLSWTGFPIKLIGGLAGLALILGGAWLFLANRRREDDAA